MDLASPSPAPPPISVSGPLILPPIVPREEPEIMGAWPISPSLTPVLSLSRLPTAETSELQNCAPFVPVEPSADNEQDAPPSHGEEAVGPEVGTNVQADAGKVDELRLSLAKLENEVNKLQDHRRKYKARFNSNVHAIDGKLNDFEDRLSDIENLYTALQAKVANITTKTITSLEDRVKALQVEMRAVSDSNAALVVAPALLDQDEVKGSILILQELVDEMRTLRETAQRQIAADVEAVRADCEIARESIAAQMAAKTSALAPTSLKRKRDDTDEDAAEAGMTGYDSREEAVPVNVVDIGVGLDADLDIDLDVQMDSKAPRGANEILPMLHSGWTDAPSPRKRARRIVTVVAQTATAVTLGAVATWSALAFS